MTKTKVFGHRGASGYAPENTLPAFELAMEQQADGIELDVQLTKDNQVVVIHDETIDRTSTGKGFVKDFTLEELRTFSFHNQMEAWCGTKIPLLKEVLELVKKGTLEVNIEIKTGIIWYPGIEKKTLEIVRETGMERRVVYSSFNHNSIRKIHELDPSAETAYLLADVMVDAENYARNNEVEGLHPSLYQMKMPDFLRQYQESGLKVRVWTVNEEEDLRLLMEQKVEAVITNDPDKAVKVRKEIG
ncbi:MAG: glycerophosphodiester phosphodiesterase [Lachnospiraceae bacterium]|nr:glycerophosphodiester phosphodiesterase [Lachnospiraceae bacterium]